MGRSPLRRLASWMSLGMIVMRLPWMAQSWASSKRPTWGRRDKGKGRRVREEVSFWVGRQVGGSQHMLLSRSTVCMPSAGALGLRGDSTHADKPKQNRHLSCMWHAFGCMRASIKGSMLLLLRLYTHPAVVTPGYYVAFSCRACPWAACWWSKRGGYLLIYTPRFHPQRRRTRYASVASCSASTAVALYLRSWTSHTCPEISLICMAG